MECHRPGEIGPFSLTDYDEVVGWAEMIAEVVREQRMPPWHANPAHGEFANANRLSDDEKQLIYDWVDHGCPEGNPADLPEPKQFHEGWFMQEQPDQVIYMTDAEVDAAIVLYECELGIPATDALTRSPERLVEMVLAAFPRLNSTACAR